MIRFRAKLIFAIIFLSILSLSVMSNVPAAVSCEPLGRAMEATGAKLDRFSVNSWVKLPSAQLDNHQLEDIVQQAMTQLGVDAQDYQLIHQQRSKHKIVQAEVTNQDFYAVVIAQVIPGPSSTAELEGYLVINIEAKTEEKQFISQIHGKIANITKKFGVSPQINTCLIGWLDGKLRDGEWHELLQHAFKAIDATIIDKFEIKQLVSYTGFTPEVTNYVQVADQKINLNMAIRYSQYDNRTYVTIGSPIITKEY